MKRPSLLTTIPAALAFAATAAVAQAERKVVDDNLVSSRVDAYIDRCNGEGSVRGCIAAVADMSLSLARTMTQYVDRTYGKTRPMDAGAVRGELMASCATPMENLGEKLYEDMADYLAATFHAVSSCERSIQRAERQIGIIYQPTARNIVLCRMDRLRGYDCR